MAKTKTPAEMVLAADAEVPVPSVDEIPWMPTPGVGLGVAFAPQSNPKVVEILKALEAEPLLVEPALRFVRQKKAELAQAQLSVLYSPKELEELRAKAESGQ